MITYCGCLNALTTNIGIFTKNCIYFNQENSFEKKKNRGTLSFLFQLPPERATYNTLYNYFLLRTHFSSRRETSWKEGGEGEGSKRFLTALVIIQYLVPTYIRQEVYTRKERERQRWKAQERKNVSGRRRKLGVREKEGEYEKESKKWERSEEEDRKEREITALDPLPSLLSCLPSLQCWHAILVRLWFVLTREMDCGQLFGPQ